MSKNDNQRVLVPRLRFPEFRDSQGWPLVPLQQLAELITTRNSDESTTRVLTNSAEYGVVDQRDYFDKDIATKGNLGNYYVVEHGDYVYNPRVSVAAPVGPISRNNIDQGVMSPLYTVFRFNLSDTDFYAHYFKSMSWHSYMRSVSSTGARHDRMSITNGAFMRMPVPEPKPAEQRKNADFLGSLDDWIAAEGRKLAALRDHKQGLMQQLFPREGETRPRLRFPEFRDDPSWQIMPVQEVATYENGKAYEKHITQEGKYVVVNSRFISTDGRIRKYSDEEFCIAASNDVLMVLSDLPNGRALAKCFLVNENEKYAVNQRVCRLTPTDVRSDFFYYALNRHWWLLAFDDGLTQTHLSKGNVLDCPLAIPRRKSEQRRVADCLAYLDAMIAAQAEKLDALRTHKRGLMQQLFPSPAGTEA